MTSRRHPNSTDVTEECLDPRRLVACHHRHWTSIMSPSERRRAPLLVLHKAIHLTERVRLRLHFFDRTINGIPLTRYGSQPQQNCGPYKPRDFIMLLSAT